MRRLSIRILADAARARLWQRQLLQDLRALGHDVQLSISSKRLAPPAIVDALLSLESLVYRRRGKARGGGMAQNWRDAAASEPAGFRPDLIVDLTANPAPPADTRTLRVVYGSSAMEEALFFDLVHGRSPLVGIVDSASPDHVSPIWPAVENPYRLNLALDNVYGRLVGHVLGAVAKISRGLALGGEALPAVDPFGGWTFAKSLASLNARATSAIARLSAKRQNWHTGWRRITGDSLHSSFRIPPGGWTRLPDDGQRFYADPFLAHHGGRDWMFVEEFPFATQKGVLSVVEIGPSGPLGTPRPVLELPHHLSYPFVFQEDGEFLMIPESSTARRVELYRAREFPLKWELDAVLIDGEDISDATLTQHNGHYYLFGSTGGPGLSSWDTLKVWWADKLRGPWSPCGDGLPMVDVRSARPAGTFFLRDGQLWRPAQDCSTGYGRALVFARVDRLSPEGFAQSVHAVVTPNDDWPGSGIHTVNAQNGLEVVDGSRD